jgi:hypothetical protein
MASAGVAVADFDFLLAAPVSDRRSRRLQYSFSACTFRPFIAAKIRSAVKGIRFT